MSARVDHLVVAARSLEEGLRWCEDTLGVVPGPGGAHALFGTHNRLLRLASAAHPQAYLEIIAIDPSAQPAREAPLRRWFDLDDPAIRQQLQEAGPQLLHWVASVPDIEAALQRWRALGIERGPVIEASRPTPDGLLRWKITVRDDGQRLFGGCLPTLIEWGQTHPTQRMATPVLPWDSLALQHPQAHRLRLALQAIGLADVPVTTGPAGLRATFRRHDGAAMALTHQEPA
ncbi:MAG: VOC family protein [Burkholderiales bacterium]|nr:MAG: VOC family protein [Burkholderiales bacterium]